MTEPILDVKHSIRPFLRDVELPGRYTGGEWNQILKDPAEAGCRVALCYPDTYEVGMSHHGLALLYHLVNREPGLWAERCFAPWPDMGAQMERRGIPLHTLESGTPVRNLDVMGISLQHELLFSNVLYLLRLAGLPWRARDRGSSAPLVVAGGCGAHSPEPMAPVFDLFLPGDGEATLIPFLRLVESMKREGADREDILLETVRLFPFAYAPALYRERIDSRGRYAGLIRLHPDAPERIRPGLVPDLDEAPQPTAPIQPGVRCVHERITLEIMRGCTRGCRFCQAGMIRRPMRTRSPERLLAAAEANYRATGYDEISLCSLSSSDHPELARIMNGFNETFAPLRVGLSLPSLRVDDRLRSVPGLSNAVRKAGLTLAPEAATERLRRRINKNVTDGDLEQGVLSAYGQGWRRVKLYFMIGLPGETDEDVAAIADLARRISDLRKRTGNGPANVTVAVSTFVPKAHTPFQWCAMDRPDRVREKHRILLGSRLPSRIRLSFHDTRMSFVEGMLARGDRRFLGAVETASREGAVFDAWKERFRLDRWEAAFAETGLDPGHHLHRTRTLAEPLSWDHIDPGVSRDFLLEEYGAAHRFRFTEWCETGKCLECGTDRRLCARLRKARKEKSDHTPPIEDHPEDASAP